MQGMGGARLWGHREEENVQNVHLLVDVLNVHLLVDVLGRMQVSVVVHVSVPMHAFPNFMAPKPQAPGAVHFVLLWHGVLHHPINLPTTPISPTHRRWVR